MNKKKQIMKIKLARVDEILDEISWRISTAENSKMPHHFIQARLKVRDAREIIKEIGKDMK